MAKKIEEEAQPGKINLSEYTKKLLENEKIGHYIFEYNKEIEISSLQIKTHSFFVDMME